jgi:hypothetical protein
MVPIEADKFEYSGALCTIVVELSVCENGAERN